MLEKSGKFVSQKKWNLVDGKWSNCPCARDRIESTALRHSRTFLRMPYKSKNCSATWSLKGICLSNTNVNDGTLFHSTESKLSVVGEAKHEKEGQCPCG